jgi:PAS domain S-box-containing protein
MLLQNEHDLIALLGVAAFILLALSIIGGVIASLKSFQVRQFQDLLFKAERKIDTLERRMFNVLNAVPVALVETDVSGKFTFANKTAHQLLGRKDSELIGLRFHSATWGIAYPDGRVIPADLMPIARTLRGQTVKGFQHLLTNHGSHEKVLVSVTSMPIMNGAGEVIGSTSAMVELETSSGEGVDDLNGLWRGHWFAAATLPFWGLDTKAQIVDINNAALDAFDLKREQALGQNWTQFFVDDADFQKAVDYLGELQDEASPHTQVSLTLTLKAPGGERQPATVTAWLVRTHEGGERGLTVMAMPGISAPRIAPIAALNDDDAQELTDHRLAEDARAALGVGTWQYDAEADTIVEDAGMMALIGRDYVGGPTLISEADQAVADVAFTQLMSGESDHLALDIQVARKDGAVRWIALEGQSKIVDGKTQIYGVAFDCTAWKQEAPAAVVEPVIHTTGITEADLEAAVLKAREEAAREHELALAEAVAAARAKALEDAPTPYDWQAPVPLPDPVIVHEPDPLVVAENAALKAQLDAAKSDLEQAEIRRDVLQVQLDEIIFTKPVAMPEPEPVDTQRLAEMTAELEMARAVQAALETELDALRKAPVPQPDYSEHEARYARLQAELEATRKQQAELARRYQALAETPAPEPDYSQHEARIQTLQSALEQVAARHTDLQAKHETLLNTPAPEPDVSAWEAKLAAAQRDIAKWQAAHDDAQGKLAAVPVVDHAALETRLSDLENLLTQSQSKQAGMSARVDQLNEALSQAQRFETVGRLTGDVAQDFAQMLGVINGALEIMARQGDSPESIRRLSEAALAAGKRGERLTRQLQAFQSEEF